MIFSRRKHSIVLGFAFFLAIAIIFVFRQSFLFPIEMDAVSRILHHHQANCGSIDCFRLKSQHIFYDLIFYYLGSLLGAVNAKTLLSSISFVSTASLLYFIFVSNTLSKKLSSLLVALVIFGFPVFLNLFIRLEDNTFFYPVILLYVILAFKKVSFASKPLGVITTGILLGVAVSINTVCAIFIIFNTCFAILNYFNKSKKRALQLIIISIIAIAIEILLFHSYGKDYMQEPLSFYAMKALNFEVVDQASNRATLTSISFRDDFKQVFGSTFFSPFINLFSWLALYLFVNIKILFFSKSKKSKFILYSGFMLFLLALGLTFYFEPYVPERWDIFLLVLTINISFLWHYIESKKIKTLVITVIFIQVLFGLNFNFNFLKRSFNYHHFVKSHLPPAKDRAVIKRSYFPLEAIPIGKMLKAYLPNSFKSIFFVRFSSNANDRVLLYKKKNYDDYIVFKSNLEKSKKYKLVDLCSKNKYQGKQIYIAPSLSSISDELECSHN